MLKQPSLNKSNAVTGKPAVVIDRQPRNLDYPRLTVMVIFFALAAIALYVGRVGRGLQIIIPLGCVAVAFQVIKKRPDTYVRLVLWTWFLTPFIRRVVDYRCGFSDQNLILTAPLLVASVALFGIRSSRQNSAINVRRLLPFLMAIGGVTFGALIGLYLHPTIGLLHIALAWYAPIFFGLYLCCHPERYQQQRKVIVSTFLQALIWLGIYGIFQYIVMPGWDVFWLTNVMDVSGANAFGRAEPGMLRVWSTFNAPGTFAIVLFAGMILLSFEHSRWKIPAFGLAVVDLALTLIRTAWLGFGVALIIMMFTAGLKSLHKYLLILIALVCCAPLVNYIPGVADLVHDRIQTFTNLKGDESYQDRQDLYQASTRTIMVSPFGTGHMSGIPIDSGIFEMLLSLGWPGTAAYVAGLLIALGNPYLFLRCRDLFLKSCLAVAIALVSMLLSGNTLVDLPGGILWICLALYWTGAQTSQVTTPTAKDGARRQQGNRATIATAST